MERECIFMSSNVPISTHTYLHTPTHYDHEFIVSNWVNLHAHLNPVLWFSL